MNFLKEMSRKIFVPGFRSFSEKVGKGSKEAAELPKHIIWRRIFFFGCVPMVGLTFVNCLLNYEHVRPEFIPYEHMRLRSKKYPWGDGVKTFFHNKRLNALPNGYEDDSDVEDL
uniref:Cytochrome c oxidase subunit n=1 Tax=Phlebotomus papatasi TaxID=29031 RepID=A0A1B0GMM6_PHLPP